MKKIYALALAGSVLSIHGLRADDSHMQWESVYRSLADAKDAYIEHFNERSASDEYNELGYIDKEKLYQQETARSRQMVMDGLRNDLQGHLATLAAYVKAAKMSVAAYADPACVTRKQAVEYVRSCDALMIIADYLYNYTKDGKYPYRAVGIKMLATTA